jgi:hypothetical protein
MNQHMTMPTNPMHTNLMHSELKHSELKHTDAMHTELTRDELTILRHTDYRCHGCWQDLRLMPQARWRMVAMPAKSRGSDAREPHLLAMCEHCAQPAAFATQNEAPFHPVPVLDGPEFAEGLALDREDASLAAGALGLLSGWFVAGPALALVGLVAGAAAGYMSVRRIAG